MGILQNYEKVCRDFIYLEPYVKIILSIFKGSGKSQIITKDTIKNSNKRVRDFLILSPTIENAMNYVYSELKDIKSSPQKFSGGMFYFSRYGGSKTQFLNIILNEIQERLPDCIVVLFQDINDLGPIQLFNKIKQSAYYNIPTLARFKDDEQKYIDLMNKLETISAEINVDLRQSSNLNNILQKIGFVKNRLQKNPQLRKKLEEGIELIHTSILVDSELVMKKILDFMKELTRNGFIFLFLYDEVDLWIEDNAEQLWFSEKFKRLEIIMKYVFESSQHEIKLFHLFACTERVNILIKNFRHTFSESTSAGSRFIWIYGRSELVPESGNYGDKIEEALSKIAAFYTLSHESFKIDGLFLEETLKQLKENFSIYSRRVVNSQILRILNTYYNLKLPLEKGIKEWRNDANKYGRLIQYHLDRILNQINIKFVRQDIKIQPERSDSDKIDGYFINYDENEKEIKTYVEIKLTKKFTGDKSYQALQWSQVKKEPIVLLIFSPDSIGEINQQIIDYAEKKGFTLEDTNRIKILNIGIPYSFSPIIGVENVITNHSKLIEFYSNYAFWLDFFGQFTGKYQKLRMSIGLGYAKPIKKKEKKELDEEEELAPEARICIDLLVKLHKKNKLSKSGRLAKNTIDNINKEFSLGISHLDKIYDLMEKNGIITKINPNTVNFSTDILKISHLEKFVQICENKFKHKNVDLNSFG